MKLKILFVLLLIRPNYNEFLLALGNTWGARRGTTPPRRGGTSARGPLGDTPHFCDPDLQFRSKF